MSASPYPLRGDEPHFPERFTWWVFIQVGLALVPLAATLLDPDGGGWVGAVGHGELLLVAVVISAAVIASAARLSPRSPKRRTLRARLMCMGILVCVLGGLVYGSLARQNDHDAADNLVRTTWSSGTFFAMSVLIGAASAYLEHVEEKVARSQ